MSETATPPAPPVAPPPAPPVASVLSGEPAPLQTPLEPDPREPEPTPPAPPAPVTPPVAAAPTPPATPEPPKMVNVGAVIEERSKRQAAELALRQAEPLLQMLHARPDLMAQLHQPPPNPAAGEQDKADLEAIARRFVLYKPDGSGQLDLDNAAAVRGWARDQAKSVASEEVKRGLAPLQQIVEQQRAQTMRERIESAAKEHGVLDHVRPLLDTALQADPNALADPQVGAALIITAKGLQAMQGLTPPAPPAGTPPAQPVTPTIPTPPLVTESPGARTVAPAELPDMMKRIAHRHGWKTDKVAKTFTRLDQMTGRHLPVEKE